MTPVVVNSISPYPPTNAERNYQCSLDEIFKFSTNTVSSHTIRDKTIPISNDNGTPNIMRSPITIKNIEKLRNAFIVGTETYFMLQKSIITLQIHESPFVVCLPFQ